MKQLFLEDLKDMNEKEIIEHLSCEYAENKYNEIIKLKEMKILIAYESVGSWGCDSTSFFLFRNKKNRKLYSVHGSHCSCYGFEGQLDYEETDLKTLRELAKKDSIFYTGGYDDSDGENRQIINEFILSMNEV